MEISEFHKNRIKMWLNQPLSDAASSCPFGRDGANYGTQKDMV
jgi:hypothetical protein